jgi:HK97 family phage prohead protease
MDKKAFRFDVKAAGQDGTFTGFAAVYGNKDRVGDIIERGAFTKTLAESGPTFPLLHEHNPERLIGLAEIVDGEKGLEVKGELNLEVAAGREVHALLKQGALKGMSIGYRGVKSTYDAAQQAFRLLEIKLLETSLVAVAANPLAAVTSVKAESAEARELVVKALQSALGLTEEEFQALSSTLSRAAKSQQEPPEHSEIRDALAAASKSLRFA